MSSSNTKIDICCCCGAGTWTKIIAWLQILPSGIAICFSILFLVIRLFQGELNFQGGIKFYLILIALEAYLLLNFLMGIVLLKGAINRLPKYLCIWRVYAIICLCIKLLLTIILSAIESSSTGDISTAPIYEGFTSIAINIFFIWVVWVFQKEIEQDQTNTVTVVTHTV